MNKLFGLAAAAALLSVPATAIAECRTVLERSIVAETTKIERLMSSLPKATTKEAKNFCRAFNKEHKEKTKPLITRYDEAIDLMEGAGTLYYHGVAEFRVCCVGPAIAK